MNYGNTISKNNAKTGDVIVFTGTDASQRIGGHVGIVLENNNGNISFIHSSSGKKNGVIISSLSEGYYTQRFLKIVRVVK
jgi:cell wall-associated NlpC family hydrolase